MTDVAQVGFSVDTSELGQASASLDTFNAKQQQIAAGSEKVATATPPASTAVKDFGVSAAAAGTASEQAAAKIATMTASMTGTTAGVGAAGAAVTAMNAAVIDSIPIHDRFGTAIKGTEVELEHAASSAHGFRAAAHALAFEAEAAGMKIGGLGPLLQLARGGIEVLAGAVAVGLVIAFETAGDKAEAFRNRIDVVFGKGTGATAFDEMSASAGRLGTSIENIEPAVETLFGGLQRLRQESTFASQDALRAIGASFAPGAGGQAAQSALIALNQQKLDPQIKQDIAELTQLYLRAGDSIVTAGQKARELATSLPATAAAARQESQAVTEEMVKLFEVAGEGPAAAGKATDDFFKKIVEGGGMTAKVFEGLPPLVQQSIAQAFKFDDVDKFEAALGKTKLPIQEILAALLGIKPAIDAMTVPTTVQNSWENLKTKVGELFDTIEFRSHIVSSALDLWAKAAETLTNPASILQGGLQNSNLPVLPMGQANIFSEPGAGSEDYFKKLQDDYTKLLPATDQAAIATDKLATSAQQVATPAASAASGLETTAGAAQNVATQAPAAGGALSSLAAAISSFVSQMGQIESQTGGGTSPSFGDTGVQASAPLADIGNQQTGGIFAIAGSGGADSVPLRGMVTPGEVLAVVPPEKATSATLAMLQAVIGSSPIDVGSGSSGVSIASPASFGATEAISGLLTGTGTAAGGIGNALGLTPAQLAAALAAIVAKAPAGAISSSGGGGSRGGSSGGGFKGIDPYANDPYSFLFGNPDPFAGFGGDPFKLTGGGSGGSRSAGAAGGGMIQNPDGSWSPAGMGHDIAPSISGGAATVSRVGAKAAGGATPKFVRVGDTGGIASQFKTAGTALDPADIMNLGLFGGAWPNLGLTDTSGQLTPDALAQLDTFSFDQSPSSSFFDPYSAYGSDQSGSTSFGGISGSFPFDAGTPYSFDPAAFDYSGSGLGTGGGGGSGWGGDYSSGFDESGFSGVMDAGGFATGGNFRVRGSGGTDSTRVSFMATPDERVIVQTPSQQASGGLPSFADGGTMGPYGYVHSFGDPGYPSAAASLSSAPSSSPGVFGFGGRAGGWGSAQPSWNSPWGNVSSFGNPGPATPTAIGGDQSSRPVVVNISTPNPNAFLSVSRMAMRRQVNAMVPG